MKILSTRRLASWWQLARRWFEKQFSDLKSDVADVKTAVENIDFTPLAKEATVAKQGSDHTATNTELKHLIQHMRESYDELSRKMTTPLEWTDEETAKQDIDDITSEIYVIPE